MKPYNSKLPFIPDRSSRAGLSPLNTKAFKQPYSVINPKGDMDENEYYKILIEKRCKMHMKNKNKQLAKSVSSFPDIVSDMT